MSDELTDEETRLLAMVPESGSTVSNPMLKVQFGGSDDDYWRVRNSLVEKSKVVRGRGRGGTVRRVIEEEPPTPLAVLDRVGTASTSPDLAPDAALSVARRELDLYAPIQAVLSSEWSKDRGASPIAVEVIALQGRRATGGRWSRPDLVCVEIKTYPYVPGKFLEVITFEVKPADAIDVQAVYEALAHQRSATHSYVILHVPGDRFESLTATIEDVRAVARSHGIGVIVAGDPGDFSTWDEQEEAQRHEPDPGRLNEFLTTQVSKQTRDTIGMRLR